MLAKVSLEEKCPLQFTILAPPLRAKTPYMVNTIIVELSIIVLYI